MENTLPPRLQAAAALIPTGVGVADVGTDHGYLPIWLCERGENLPVIASDLRPGPLSRAVENAKKAGYGDKIRFCLSDGLDEVPEDGIGCVSICGMGGETIREILSRPRWLKDRPMTLILQPQTKLRELCQWLSENGWGLAGGSLCLDAGRIYPVLAVTGAADRWDARELDRLYLAQREPLFGRWICLRREKAQKALDGIRKSANPQAPEAEELERELEWLEKLER